MAIEILTPPEVEPVSLAEARTHLRVDHVEEDALIEALVTAAREDAESWTRRALITQALRFTRDTFPCDRGPIELPRPTLQAVTSLKYTDTAGVERTLVENTDFVVDKASKPARLSPAHNTAWPATLDQVGAVRIEYTAGYGDEGASVPGPIRAAIKLTLGHLYVNRSPVITGTIVQSLPTVQNLLRPYRIVGAPA